MHEILDVEMKALTCVLSDPRLLRRSMKRYHWRTVIGRTLRPRISMRGPYCSAIGREDEPHFDWIITTVQSKLPRAFSDLLAMNFKGSTVFAMANICLG